MLVLALNLVCLIDVCYINEIIVCLINLKLVQGICKVKFQGNTKRDNQFVTLSTVTMMI